FLEGLGRHAEAFALVAHELFVLAPRSTVFSALAVRGFAPVGVRRRGPAFRRASARRRTSLRLKSRTPVPVLMASTSPLSASCRARVVLRSRIRAASIAVPNGIWSSNL